MKSTRIIKGQNSSLMAYSSLTTGVHVPQATDIILGERKIIFVVDFVVRYLRLAGRPLVKCACSLISSLDGFSINFLFREKYWKSQSGTFYFSYNLNLKFYSSSSYIMEAKMTGSQVSLQDFVMYKQKLILHLAEDTCILMLIYKL